MIERSDFIYKGYIQLKNSPKVEFFACPECLATIDELSLGIHIDWHA